MKRQFDMSIMDNTFLENAKKECERFPEKDWPEDDRIFYDAVIKEIKKRKLKRLQAQGV